MNQAELIDALSEATELSKADCKRVLDSQAEIVSTHLKKGKDGAEVALPGLGKFKIKDRAARLGRNPQTGEEIKIPAKRVPSFSPSKVFKETVLKRR